MFDQGSGKSIAIIYNHCLLTFKKGVIAVFPLLSALSSDPFLFIKGQEKRSGTPTADKKESTPTVHNPYLYI